MNLLSFASPYPDELSCRKKFKEFRDQQGVICPSCGHTEHYWKQDKESYECKHCGRRQSLRAHTYGNARLTIAFSLLVYSH